LIRTARWYPVKQENVIEIGFLTGKAAYKPPLDYVEVTGLKV